MIAIIFDGEWNRAQWLADGQETVRLDSFVGNALFVH